MKKFFIIIFFILFHNYSDAQRDSGILPQKDSNTRVHKKNIVKKQATINKEINNTDSLNKKETTKPDTLSVVKVSTVNVDSLRKDSLAKTIAATHSKNYDSILSSIGLPVFAKPIYMLMPEKKSEQKDELFYVLAGIIFLLALVKTIFPRYLQNTFNLFFQKSGADVNTRYASQQNSSAFFLMQLVFICCGGIYITLISERYFNLQYTFGEELFFSAIFLGCIYIVKDISIKILGWIFNLQSEAKIYLLFVFLVNMVLAIALLPIVLVLAFSQNELSSFFLAISFILLVVFFVYRYFLTIKAVQSKYRAKTIQIFIYLCAVEILPIVLLFKLLFNYTRGMN